jgi:hypothetical protein
LPDSISGDVLNKYVCDAMTRDPSMKGLVKTIRKAAFHDMNLFILKTMTEYSDGSVADDSDGDGDESESSDATAAPIPSLICTDPYNEAESVISADSHTKKPAAVKRVTPVKKSRKEAGVKALTPAKMKEVTPRREQTDAALDLTRKIDESIAVLFHQGETYEIPVEKFFACREKYSVRPVDLNHVSFLIDRFSKFDRNFLNIVAVVNVDKALADITDADIHQCERFEVICGCHSFRAITQLIQQCGVGLTKFNMLPVRVMVNPLRKAVIEYATLHNTLGNAGLQLGVTDRISFFRDRYETREDKDPLTPLATWGAPAHLAWCRATCSNQAYKDVGPYVTLMSMDADEWAVFEEIMRKHAAGELKNQPKLGSARRSATKKVKDFPVSKYQNMFGELPYADRMSMFMQVAAGQLSTVEMLAKSTSIKRYHQVERAVLVVLGVETVAEGKMISTGALTSRFIESWLLAFKDIQFNKAISMKIIPPAFAEAVQLCVHGKAVTRAVQRAAESPASAVPSTISEVVTVAHNLTYQVIKGDAIKCDGVARGSSTLSISDVPYGINLGGAGWDKEAISEEDLHRHCRSVIALTNGLINIAIFCNFKLLIMVMKVLQNLCPGDDTVSHIYWFKPNMPNFRRGMKLQNVVEHLVIGHFNPSAGGGKVAGHTFYEGWERKTNVVEFPYTHQKIMKPDGTTPVNLAQKPVFMLKWVIDHYSEAGSTVLDLFSGVGKLLLCVFAICFVFILFIVAYCCIFYVLRCAVAIFEIFEPFCLNLPKSGVQFFCIH